MWFTFDDLKTAYPEFKKIQDASDSYVTNTIIPKAQDYVAKFVGISVPWDDGDVPDDILRVTMNYAVNSILADDENIRMAQARGQPRFTVAGDEVVLDLSLGRNPLLSLEDEAILMEWRAQFTQLTHTDKIVVRSEGDRYDSAPGGGDRGEATDYVRGDRPSYFAGQ